METIWHNLADIGVPVLEKIFRPIVIYVFLIVGLRLAGKRELAQLNTFDLIVLLTISNTVQNAIIGSDNSLIGGMIGATTLLAVNYATVRFLFAHEQLDKLVEGEPVTLVEGGVVREDCCKKEFITRSELEIAAHKQGFGSLAEIQTAVLEPGGTIFFTPREPKPEVARYQEVISRLDQISQELAALRAASKGD